MVIKWNWVRNGTHSQRIFPEKVSVSLLGIYGHILDQGVIRHLDEIHGGPEDVFNARKIEVVHDSSDHGGSLAQI